MAYNLELAKRMRAELEGMAPFSERKMFGGIGFMVNGNLACGVHGESLIVRVGAERYAETLQQPYTRPFDLSGKPMSGWVYVDPAGCESAQEMKKWIQWGVDYASTLQAKG